MLASAASASSPNNLPFLDELTLNKTSDGVGKCSYSIFNNKTISNTEKCKIATINCDFFNIVN